MVFLVLLAAAASVLAVGVLATVVLFSTQGGWPKAPGAGFWVGLLAACGLTVASLGVRSLRWVFLLRRADIRIPIRDAYIGYFAGLSLLFAPLLAGEIAVRAYVLRLRGGVPVQTTIVVNVWERLLDLAALGSIAAAAAVATGSVSLSTWVPFAGVVISLVPMVRRVALGTIIAAAQPLARLIDDTAAHACGRLTDTRTWTVALLTSIVAWLLPAIGFWILTRGSAQQAFRLVEALHAYAASTTMGVLSLAPGGILIAGPQMLASLGGHGFHNDAALLVVLGVRLATAGVSLVFGLVFLLIHMCSASAASATHFDDIADVYDVQIPEFRRRALLLRKSSLMQQVVDSIGIGRCGLDVGCGQGTYVARMRELGFDVVGIDDSAGQVRLATRNVDGEGVVTLGSVLDIPANDASFDFLYIINVLHHLNSIEEQRRAFTELLRVLKPGGLLFVHEINTRNILFRFYMGYLFPSLNCIDAGIERWLLPHRLSMYTPAQVVDVRYFTFLPDFIPALVMRVLAPFERLLEASAMRAYSAHYMTVLRK